MPPAFERGVQMNLIVNFHGVGRPARPLDPGEDAVWVEQSEALRILDLLAGRQDVIVTSDDGNSSDVDFLGPALVERGIRGMFFPITARLGQDGYLSPRDLEGLVSMGMEIGSHGHSHRPFRSLTADEIDREIRESTLVLEGCMAGRVSSTIALPFGSYDRRVLRALRSIGEGVVLSSDGGWCPGLESGGLPLPRNSVGRGKGCEWVRELLFRPRIGLVSRAKRIVKAWR